jgi:hypothetical protein
MVRNIRSGRIESVYGTIYVATDPDEAGEQAAAAIAEILPDRTHRLVWGYGDISDYLTRFEPVERHKEWKRLIHGR